MSNVQDVPTTGTTCGECIANGGPGEFKISVSLGREGGTGVPRLANSLLGTLDFNGSLVNIDLFSPSTADFFTTADPIPLNSFRLSNVLGVVDGSPLDVDGAVVLSPEDNTPLVKVKATFSGTPFSAVTFTVEPLGAAAGPITEHVFERHVEGAYEGMRYTRRVVEEEESMAFYNAGATSWGSKEEAFGNFKTVDVNKDVKIWETQSETENGEPRMYWDTSVTPNRWNGQLFEMQESIPASGTPTKVERYYAKIGAEYKSAKVLITEITTTGTGAAEVEHATHYGYYDDASSVYAIQKVFALEKWRAESTGDWKFKLRGFVPNPADPNIVETIEYTPWKDGPAGTPEFDSREDAEGFFATLATEVAGGASPTGCLRRRIHDNTDKDTSDGWAMRVVSSIGGVQLGTEYEYDDRNRPTFTVPGMAALQLQSRSERWDSSATRSTWQARFVDYKGGNGSVSVDQTGVATLTATGLDTGGQTATDTWQALATEADGYGTRREPPGYEMGAEHPLFTTVIADSQGRPVEERRLIREGGIDTLYQSINTTYTGETGYSRSTAEGNIILATQGEDVVAGGLRTSTSTDAQGVMTVTVTHEDTGELISETKKGVPLADGHAAQPDVTTSYATSTNPTTLAKTQTVTQSDGTTTRTLSVTVTDVQGRTQSVTDGMGRVTTYTYSNHDRTVTETSPSGTRITENYLDGQLKSVRGTAVTPEYHVYTVNSGGSGSVYEAGSITETVYLNDDGTGGTRSEHWRKTTTNFLGQVLREEEPSPATGVIVTTHTYNAKGQRVKTSRAGADTATAAMLVEYDAFGRVVKQGYDVAEDDALTAVSADILTETLVSYEEVGTRWVEKTLQRRHTQEDGNNAQDTITRSSLAEGGSWQSTTGADGSMMIYEATYNAAGHLLQEAAWRAANEEETPVVVQTQVSYNGLLVAQSVPEASTTMTFDYNGFGQIVSQVHPMAGTSTWTYDSATGQQLTQTVAGSGVVTYTYYSSSHANAGQVATVTANGEVTRYAYDAQGRKTHQWGTGSQPLKYVYDGLGRLHELHTYQGGTGWGNGSLPGAFGSATAAVTTWDYRSGTSALWKKTDADSHGMTYTYVSSGLLSTKTNARGITTTYSYAQTTGGKKLPGMVTTLDYSDSTPDVDMTYRRSGEVATVTDAAGVSTFTGSVPTRTTTVTGGGLMTGLVLTRSEFEPDMPETVQAQVGGSTVMLNQHQWNANGSLAKAWQGDRTTGAGGTGIRHVWNRNSTTGRLESITTEAFGSGATHGIARGYMHTAGGKVEKIWYNAGTLGSPDTSVQGFEYDQDTYGRREVVAPYLPDNAPATSEQPPGWKYGYNERGEVTVADRFKAEGGPSTGVVTHQRRNYAYDLMGNRHTATQGTASGEINETGYTANILQQYDGITHTRLVEITGQAVAGATVELTLDAGTPFTVNRSLAANQTGDPNSFRYVHTMGGTDARWLHVSIKASAGGIDIVRAGFVYVPPASEVLGYDDDGNLTETAQWDYTWDAENRLIVAEQKSLPVASGLTAPVRKQLTFAYDSKNRRIAKTVREWRAVAGGGFDWVLTKDLRFVYDGWQMIAELDHTFATGTGLAGSAVNRTFLWGPDLSGSMTGAGGVGGLLSTTYQGVTYQVCSDANGNVTGLVPANDPEATVTSTNAGTLAARFDYDPFGNRVTNAGPSAELCPFGFSSKYLDTESGVVSYELREYLPELSRWISRDPLGEQGGMNLYKIASNDLVNKVDYLGLVQINAEATFKVEHVDESIVGASGGVQDPNPFYITYKIDLVPGEHQYQITIVSAKAVAKYYKVDGPGTIIHEDKHVSDWKSAWANYVTQANRLDGYRACCRKNAECWGAVLDMYRNLYLNQGKYLARLLHANGGVGAGGEWIAPYAGGGQTQQYMQGTVIARGIENIKKMIEEKKKKCSVCE